MKRKLFTLFCLGSLLLHPSNDLCATSTDGSTTRNVRINGDVGNEKGAANGTNGNNWELDEATGTTSPEVTMYMTWDDTYLYLGWEGGNKFQQHIIWIDTDPQDPATNGTGSTSTFEYGNITATLPFTGNFFANVEANYNEYRNYSGSGWDITGMANALAVFTNNNNDDLEARIPWSVMGGRPQSMYILGYINDPAGNGNTGFVYGVTGGTPSGTSGAVTFSNFHSAVITGGQAPWGGLNVLLPVTLTHFTARAQGEAVHLSWGTSMEQDNDYFAVERSGDGRSFRELGRVAGAGTTVLLQAYEWVDRAPLPGWNYYRLRQVDFDGSFEYHPVAAVAFKGAEQPWQAFPNPARERLYLRGSPEGAGRFALFNAFGQELRAWPAAAAAEGLGIEGLPPGWYHLRWLPAEAAPGQSLPVLIRE
jgi:hypothetical protein